MPETCPNEEHRRPVPARYRLSWPEGRWRTCIACSGCMRWMFRDSLQERQAVLVEPITTTGSVT